ncbi:putative toxin-antitoxin system toxin component, PIN family [Candidatus Peregrinibacteria bacterium]|nr:putative toxin-antitoxin system toxin component, PIN family [Candidatus Peregrinibacteria bacterium]
MKIVLDTNVLVSGIFWSDSPSKIVALWAENKITILITKKILNEYFRVLNEIDKNGEIAKKWCSMMIENCPVIEDKNYIQICRDPDNNKFLDCALIGKDVSFKSDFFSVGYFFSGLIIWNIVALLGFCLFALLFNKIKK